MSMVHVGLSRDGEAVEGVLSIAASKPDKEKRWILLSRPCLRGKRESVQGSKLDRRASSRSRHESVMP